MIKSRELKKMIRKRKLNSRDAIFMAFEFVVRGRGKLLKILLRTKLFENRFHYGLFGARIFLLFCVSFSKNEDIKRIVQYQKNRKDINEDDSINFAAYHGFISVLKYFKSKGKDIFQDKYLRSSLRGNQPETFMYLLNGQSPKKYEDDFWLEVICHQNLSFLKKMISCGLMLNEEVILRRAIDNEIQDVVRFIISRGYWNKFICPEDYISLLDDRHIQKIRHFGQDVSDRIIKIITQKKKI